MSQPPPPPGPFDPWAPPPGGAPYPSPNPPAYPPPAYPPAYPPPAYPGPAAADDPRRPWSRHPYLEPQPYHRLMRTARGRWWMPVVGVPAGIVGFLLGGVAIAVVAMVVVIVTGGTVDEQTVLAPDSPGYYLMVNLSLAVGIPVAVLLVLVVHRERPGWLSSVTGRLRWRLFVPFGLAALVIELVSLGAVGLVPSPDDEGPLGETTGFPGAATFVAFLAVLLLTTPLQAAAEEYVFRGYLGQAIGFFSRSWLPGAVVGGLLFAAAHYPQDAGAFVDRFAFGVLFAWMAWRTGGLEAPIAAHTVHNLVALLLAAAAGALPDPSVATELPWRYLLVDLVTFVVYAVVVDRLCRRRAPATRSVVQAPTAVVGGFPGA